MMKEEYEIIVPVVKKNLPLFLNYVLPKIQCNLAPLQIILLGNKELADSCRGYNCCFMDEDRVLNGLTLEKIRSLILQRRGNATRAGWYFQQFLKMAWARVTEQPYYLVWDADTLPLNKILFFDKKGHILFNEKKEFHRPYFVAIDVLFSGKIQKKISGSFIAEHMMIAKEPMKKMLDEIELNSDTGSAPFYEKIIQAVPLDALSCSGFSEFETFGNWVVTRFPDLYRSRHLRSMRQGGTFIGIVPPKKSLMEAAKFYDMISCETPNQKQLAVSRYMPCITRFFIFWGIPLPRIVSVYNYLRLFFRKKIKHEELTIIE